MQKVNNSEVLAEIMLGAFAHKIDLLNTLKWVEQRIEGLTKEIEEEKSKASSLG
jgi:hypothetical protein